MNTTNILLATTSLLIVVAFGLTFGGFSKSRENPENKEKIALLEKQIEAMEAETRAFELSQMQTSRSATPPPSPSSATLPIEPSTTTTAIDDSEREELEQRIKDLEEANKALESETQVAFEKQNKVKIEQELAAKRVKMALDMGKVVTANKESGLVIFDPSASSPNHQPGTVLSVRRNSGILGEIEIERLAENGQYVANMRPQVFAPDGYPDIMPGDTIIVDPNK